jgi:hypothetical protein
VLRRETLARDQSGPLSGGISPGDLWSKRQEQLIQELLGKEIPPDFALLCY